jgi:predicted ester cyclase
MTRDQIAGFFRERQGQWAARDPEGLSRGHAADCVVESPMHGTPRGRAAIEDAYRALFAIFPDWTFEGDELYIDGDRVAQPFRATATHVGDFMGIAGTNRRCRIEGVRLYRLQDGLIVHERRLYDFTGLLIQLGVLRSKPARS